MKQYVVDAFTDKVFHGNQAAVCVLDAWLPEEMMMNITRENNFSETAFTVKEGEEWHLRWFTPGGEIDLCGHATLGTAFVLLNYYEKDAEKVVFTTLSFGAKLRETQSSSLPLAVTCTSRPSICLIFSRSGLRLRTVCSSSSTHSRSRAI